MSNIESLVIEGTINTPSITFDTEKNIFEIAGKSMPEDAVTFFKPVESWVKQFAESSIDEAKFDIRLEYFNTASSKLILGLIKKIAESGASITIDWYYMEDDEDMQEVGEHLASILGEDVVNIILI